MNDFDNEGKLITDNFFEKFDGSKFVNVFKEVYGDKKIYDYGFKYKYEYEFYYHSKVQNAIKDAEADIEEYKNKIASEESEEDKENLKNKLLKKYNTENLEFLTADSSFDITFDKESYSAYIREGNHRERILPDGKYYVGKNAEEIVRHR